MVRATNVTNSIRSLRFDPENGLLGPKSAINLAIWDKFVEHGIQIPFPQREVRVLGDVSMIPQESRQA